MAIVDIEIIENDLVVNLEIIENQFFGEGVVEEAPIDGNQYARKDVAWEKVVEYDDTDVLKDSDTVSLVTPTNKILTESDSVQVVLTDGNATTANGDSVDLGGALTKNTIIEVDTNTFEIERKWDNFGVIFFKNNIKIEEGGIELRIAELDNVDAEQWSGSIVLKKDFQTFGYGSTVQSIASYLLTDNAGASLNYKNNTSNTTKLEVGTGVKISDDNGLGLAYTQASDTSNITWATDDKHIASIGMIKANTTIYDDTAIQAEVTLNTAKVGITTQQSTDITTNNAKVTNVNHPLVETAVPAGALFTDTVYDDTDVLKDTDTLSPVNAGNKLLTESDVAASDPLKINYTDNPTKVQTAGIRAFDDVATGTLWISIDGLDIP